MGRFAAGAAGGVLVFDVTDRGTFEHLDVWADELERYGRMAKVLVGNKSERPTSERQVGLCHVDQWELLRKTKKKKQVQTGR